MNHGGFPVRANGVSTGGVLESALMLRLILSTNEASSVVLASCSQILNNVEVVHLISWAGCTTKGSGILHREGCRLPKMLFCSASNSVLEDCKCIPPVFGMVLKVLGFAGFVMVHVASICVIVTCWPPLHMFVG